MYARYRPWVGVTSAIVRILSLQLPECIFGDYKAYPSHLRGGRFLLSVLLQFGTARSLRMDRQGGRSGPDTAEIFNEPGAMDAGFAVFCNLLEVDEKGTVTNFK